MTGGYVYRGAAIPGLAGRYLYGDLCIAPHPVVRLERQRGRERARAHRQRSRRTRRSASLASFGEDLNGELYVADLSGTVFRIDARLDVDRRI